MAGRAGQRSPGKSGREEVRSGVGANSGLSEQKRELLSVPMRGTGDLGQEGDTGVGREGQLAGTG